MEDKVEQKIHAMIFIFFSNFVLEIHLLGGGPWEHKTTEIVTSRGTKPGFNLRLEQK